MSWYFPPSKIKWENTDMVEGETAHSISLCSSGWPEIHSIDQAGLELSDSPASASWVLCLTVHTPMPNFIFLVYAHECKVCKRLENDHKTKIGSPWTRSYKCLLALSSGFWDLNSSPQEEQQVPFAAVPSLQPPPQGHIGTNFGFVYAALIARNTSHTVSKSLLSGLGI